MVKSMMFMFMNEPLTMPRQNVYLTADSKDSDGDGLTDAYEVGKGRYEAIPGKFTWEEAINDAEKKRWAPRYNNI